MHCTCKMFAFILLYAFLQINTLLSQVVDQLYFPTGIKESSPLLIEHSYPEKIIIQEDHQAEVRVINNSETVIQEIAIALTLPQSFELREAPEEASYVDGILSWTISKLEGGQTATLIYSGIYTQAGDIDQTLNVVCNQLLQNSLTSGLTAYSRKKISSLDLSIAAVSRAWPDTPFPVTFKVSNKGEVTQKNIRILTELSPGMDYVDAEELGAFTIPILEAGENYTTKVTMKALEKGLYQISADAISDESRSLKKEHSVEIGDAGLFSSGTNTIQAVAGVETPLLFRVQNTSEVPAKFCKVSVKIPEDFIVTKVDPYTNTDYRALVWFPGNLQPGQHSDFDIYGVATKTGAYSFDIAAESMDGGKGSLSMGMDSMGVASTEVDIYDLQDPIKLEEITTVFIKLSNKGNGIEKKLAINTSINPEDSLLSAEISGVGQASEEDLQIAPGSVSWKMDSGLDKNAEIILKIQMRGSAPGVINVNSEITLDSVNAPILRSETIKVLDY